MVENILSMKQNKINSECIPLGVIWNQDYGVERKSFLQLAIRVS